MFADPNLAAPHHLAIGETGEGLSLWVALLLIALLLLKELLAFWDNPQSRRLGSLLTIGIIPLLIAFLGSVAVRIASALR